MARFIYNHQIPDELSSRPVTGEISTVAISAECTNAWAGATSGLFREILVKRRTHTCPFKLMQKKVPNCVSESLPSAHPRHTLATGSGHHRDTVQPKVLCKARRKLHLKNLSVKTTPPKACGFGKKMFKKSSQSEAVMGLVSVNQP